MDNDNNLSDNGEHRDVEVEFEVTQTLPNFGSYTHPQTPFHSHILCGHPIW